VPVPPEPDTDWARGLGPLFLTAIVLTAGTLVGLALWFRRGDREIRERLRRLRLKNEFVPPAPDRVPLAAPLAQPVAPTFPINRLEGFTGGPGSQPESPAGPPFGG